MIEWRYATKNDAVFIAQTQCLAHVRTYVSSATEDEIVAIIDNLDQAYLFGLNDVKLPVGFEHLRGLRKPSRSIELFQLAIAETGAGYGSKLLKAAMAEAFKILNANRLWLDVFPQNSRARKVYQRCGFVEEGELRDAYLWDGEFQSIIIMSILAKEYACY